MNFSQRIGKTPIDTSLQVESANEALRAGLWNVLYRFLIEEGLRPGGGSFTESVLDDLWERFYKLAVDERPKPQHASVQLKHWVFTCDWYRLYDLLEFLVSAMPQKRVAAFEAAVNKVLERERSAFRLMRGMVVPITDAVEFDSVVAANDSLRMHGIDASREHLGNALGELAQRAGAGDYDYAALEAARAVQALYEHLTGRTEATPREAMDAIDPEHLLPPPLHDLLDLLFRVGDQPDTRHFFRQSPRDAGLAEARFMVVSASAAIHYLLDRAEGLEPPATVADTPKRLTGGTPDTPAPKEPGSAR